jgi:hypothetical protein
MWRFIFPVLLAACSPVDQESVRTVAAIEVPLQTEGDRTDLVAMLRRHADASGLHVDDGSEEWRQFEREANLFAPEDRLTFNVGVWRGANDDEAEAFADDRFHPGRIWVTFLRGSEPDRSTSFRVPLLAEIRRRWRDARPIPILPSGGVPLVGDLVLTRNGYRIARSAAATYGLPPTAPILAPD